MTEIIDLIKLRKSNIKTEQKILDRSESIRIMHIMYHSKSNKVKKESST